MLYTQLVNSQPSGGGGNNPQTSIAYPVVVPILGLDSSSGLQKIIGYNFTVDIIVNPGVAPLTGTYTCSLSSGLAPAGGGFNNKLFYNQTVKYGVRSTPGLTTSGYRYFARINAVFVNITTDGIALLPPFIRGDCLAGGGTLGAVNTKPYPIYGVSPSIVSVGSWTPNNNPNYANGQAWGPITVSGLDTMSCTSTTEVVLMVGPIRCSLLSGSSSTSSPLTTPHCSNLIANPTVVGQPPTPSTWDLYCATPVLAGTFLPVTLHLTDTLRNSSVASSSPDNAALTISATAPIITAVDLYSDAVTSIFTHYVIPYGSNTSIVRDVPASSSMNTAGRIVVTLGSNTGICPRVELRTNTTILRVWQFASSSAVSMYCGLNATLIGTGNKAELINFPSSSLSASALDSIYGLGFRLVVGDGIRVPTTTEVYYSDSEVAGGGAWLIRYAAPTITAVGPPMYFRAGTLGAPFYKVNITGTNFGPVTGPFVGRPTALIGGALCSQVQRAGDSAMVLTTPVGSGNSLSLQLILGDNEGLSSFSYPTPSVEMMETVSSATWNTAATLAAFAPRSISVGNVARRHPRGSILNVSSDSVVIIHGRNFGPWKGNGTKTSDVVPANIFWEFGSYGNNINTQCIATPWAGRGSTAAAPNCNGILDYVSEGELPNSGTILYWNDTMIAFAAPPSGAGYREVVINFASGISTYSSTNWYDVTALLHYGVPTLGEYGLITIGTDSNGNTTFSLQPGNLSNPIKIPATGEKAMYITGSFFQVEDTVPPSNINTPVQLPSNRAGLFTMPIPDFAFVAFSMGNPATATQCVLRNGAPASSFGINPSYMNPAVPVPCHTGVGAGISFAITNNKTALIPLPAGNGVNITVVPMFFDAIPDPVKKGMTVVNIIASAVSKSSGVAAGPTEIDHPKFSYLEPTITLSTPNVVSVATNLATVTTRFTMYGLDIGVEDTAGCTVGAGAPSITTAITFVPTNPNAQAPIGDYNAIPEMGNVLGKVKGTGSTACSTIMNTYAYFPNLPVGRYGVRLTATSTMGARTVEVPGSNGVAFTCGAGYYGQDGQRCMGCGAFSGASCPGGNASFDALDLSAPVVASAGYYNYFGNEESACPPNTPMNNKPTGRNVCVAQCAVTEACLGNNKCSTGYVSSAPDYGCDRCDVGYVRVNATQCGTVSALANYGGKCVLASVCTNAGGTSRVITGIGKHGEDVCWCNDGEAPSPSPSPSYLPPSATPTSSPSATSSPSVSGTPAAASATGTPTPSGTGTSSSTPTPSSTVAPDTCNDNLINGGESDVDCGGNGGCSKCVAGLQCRVSTDCIGAAGGTLSDAVCSDATHRCVDVRTGGSYWDSITSGGSTNGGTSTPLSFTVTLNATVAPAGLTADGLEALRVIFETVSKQQLVRGGIATDIIYTVAALSSVERTGHIFASTGRRLQSANISGVVVLITANIIVAPTSSAPADWDASVKDVVGRGAFSAASMAGPLQTALSSSSSVAWSNSAANGQLAIESSSTEAQGLISIVSVENAVHGTNDAGSGGIVGVAIFIIALVGLSVGFIMHSLRTKGEFLGQRMTPLATVFGLWPLSDSVKHTLRMNSAGKYGRKLNNRNIMGMANPDDVTITANPIANGLPSSGITYMMPNNVPVTTSYPMRTSFAPSGTDYNVSSGNPMNGMTVTTPLAMYTSPRAAARQGSMMFTTNI